MQVWFLAGRFPGGGHGNPFQYSCQENPMDRRSWGGGYSPWGHKESVMAKHTQSQFWSRFLPHLRLSVLCLKTDFSYEFWFKRKLFYLLPIGFPASFWTSFHLLWIQFGTLWIFILSFSEPSWGTYWESYIMYYYTWHWKTQPLMSFWWPLSQQLLLHLNPPWH